MRCGVAALILAGALAAQPPLVHADPPAGAPAPPPHAATPPPQPAPKPAPQPDDTFLTFYPPAARAAGVEGEATIKCARTEHLAMTGCTLVSETPAGQGFGAAALAMAAQSKDNPKLSLREVATMAPQETTLRFSLHPPGIAPDITRMAHVLSNPSIVTKPTTAQIQAAYPARALDDQVQGGAIIDCVVNETGALQECRVAAESPDGYGFGQAAVDLAGDFVMKPGQLDGDPVGGRPVRISVAFTSPTGDPAAPLTLGVKPPPPP
jgi:TonB family protein